MANGRERASRRDRYRGDPQVRPYRRGTYLGNDYFVALLVEQALDGRYRFSGGWKGFAEVSILLSDERTAGDGRAGKADWR